MSGRGRYIKRTQGRGNPQARGGNSSGSNASKKQFVTDFNYYLGSARQGIGV